MPKHDKKGLPNRTIRIVCSASGITTAANSCPGKGKGVYRCCKCGLTFDLAAGAVGHRVT